MKKLEVQVKRAIVSVGKILPMFLFHPLRPFKLKKHERLAHSEISLGPYYRAWTTITEC